MWDRDGKLVGINDKTQHNLPWPDDQLGPLVHGMRTLPNRNLWFVHHNKDGFNCHGSNCFHVCLIKSKHKCIVNIYTCRKIQAIPVLIDNALINSTRESRCDLSVPPPISTCQDISCLCLMTKSNLFTNTFIKALIACLNASQLDADVVEPNTIAVARLYKS
jgi:hypothetical protein